MTTWWNKMIGSIGGGKNSAGIVDYDGSGDYTKNKKVAFHIYHANSRNVITFKPFLTSLSYKIQYQEGEEIIKRIDGYLKRDTPKADISYSIALDIPSASLEEAKLNLAKINQLKEFQFSLKTPSGNVKDMSHWLANAKFVYLSNLIQNGRTTKGKKISSWNKMIENGLPGLTKDIKIDIKKELGFFEEKGILYPKYVTVSFDLIVLVEQVFIYSKKRLYTPYKASSYYGNDSRYWPFGVKGYKSSSTIKKYDGSQTYANNKGAWFSLCNKDNPYVIAILPFFMESLNFNYSNPDIDSEENLKGSFFFEKKPQHQPKKQLSVSVSFNAPAHSLEDAKYTMYTIQKLIRLINLNKDDYKTDNVNVSTFIPSDTKKYWDRCKESSAHYDSKLRDAVKPDTFKSNGKQIYNYSLLSKSQKDRLKAKLKKYFESSTPDEANAYWNTNYDATTRSNVVHITSLVGKDKISGKPTYDKVITNGHDLHIKSFSFEPDLTLGFFEEDGMLYYKLIKFSFEMEAIAGSGLLNGMLADVVDDKDKNAYGLVSNEKMIKSLKSSITKIEKTIEEYNKEDIALQDLKVDISTKHTDIRDNRKHYDAGGVGPNPSSNKMTFKELVALEELTTDLQADYDKREEAFLESPTPEELRVEIAGINKDIIVLEKVESIDSGLSTSPNLENLIKINK